MYGTLSTIDAPLDIIKTRPPGVIGVLSAAWMPTRPAFTSVFQEVENSVQLSSSIGFIGRAAPAMRISRWGATSPTPLFMTAPSVESPETAAAPNLSAALSFPQHGALAVTRRPRV